MLMSPSFSISYMEELFVLHSCSLFVFCFFLLPADLLLDLGQNPSPKQLHLLRNDKTSLLMQGVYNETSGKIIILKKKYYKECGAVGEGFLYDQQFI